jgi:hypothetical protein
LVPINLEMEWLCLFNKLEHLRHVNQRSFNQPIFIPHVELIEPRTTPTVVWQGIIYPQGTWPMRSIPDPSERSQIPHHRLVSGGN